MWNLRHVFLVPRKKQIMSTSRYHKFVVLTIRAQRKSVTFVWLNEGGELAGSAEVWTTHQTFSFNPYHWRYASSINGKDERSHRTTNEMIRCLSSYQDYPLNVGALHYKWLHLLKGKFAPKIIPRHLMKYSLTEFPTTSFFMSWVPLYTFTQIQTKLKKQEVNNIFS